MDKNKALASIHSLISVLNGYIERIEKCKDYECIIDELDSIKKFLKMFIEELGKEIRE